MEKANVTKKPAPPGPPPEEGELYGSDRTGEMQGPTKEVSMRRVIVSEFVALDGVIENPSWTFRFTGEEQQKFKFDELSASDALLLGQYADMMNGYPKYVVSTTLEEPLEWNNSTLIKENVAEAVSNLKRQPGKDILIFGSGNLVNTLMQHDLIDEYRLMIFLINVGSGQRLFVDGIDEMVLELVDTEAFGSGVVVLTYRSAGKEVEGQMETGRGGESPRKVHSSDGTAIAFDRLGDGPPVILVGGALQDRMGNAQLAALLAPLFTVFNYDRRGRGNSGDTAPYAVEREIEDIEALTNEAGGSVFVFGSSSGANLALEAAAQGLNITKLALWEPNFIVDDSRPPLPKDYAEQLTELVSSGRRGDAVEFFMTKAVGLPVEFVAPMRNMPMWKGMEAEAHTLAYDGTIVRDNMAGNPVSAEQWATVTVPTLVIDGGETPWLSEGAQAIADALPNARRRTLKGQTHDVAPDVLAPVLEELFAG
jgi:dihydrofolate reductase/alpha-beta hydrolase superfamily lysophospholipase